MHRTTASFSRKTPLIDSSDIPVLKESTDDFRRALEKQGQRVSLPAGATICHQGNTCQHLPILLQGRARVFKLSESGKEITLYRITEGESCVLTASCIMSDISFPAIAVTEEDSEALIIPAATVIKWFDEFPIWRSFIFQMVSLRLSSILTVIEEVAFQRMDNRLISYLVKTAENDGVLRTTHQQIADELGTAREVITRLLRDLEADGKISLKRGMIKLTDINALTPPQ